MELNVIIRGIEFNVGFDYQPYEPKTRDYPGCDPNIENVYEITHNGTDFMEFFENNLELVTDAIWEELECRAENKYL